MHFRRQSANQIVHPERGRGVVSHWNLQLKSWLWQSRLREDVMEGKPHLGIPTGALKRLANERGAVRPKRQVSGEWQNGNSNMARERR
jgi:hypothetical protein